MLSFMEFIEHPNCGTPDCCGACNTVSEAGAFSYGYKVPRKGSSAYNAMMMRKQQEKDQKVIEPKDQKVGNAKVTKEEVELDEAESWEAGYKRRVVKTTSAEHKEKGHNWRIKGKERPEISIKLYKEKPSQQEFNKQMKRVAGHEFGG